MATQYLWFAQDLLKFGLPHRQNQFFRSYIASDSTTAMVPARLNRQPALAPKKLTLVLIVIVSLLALLGSFVFVRSAEQYRYPFREQDGLDLKLGNFRSDEHHALARTSDFFATDAGNQIDNDVEGVLQEYINETRNRSGLMENRIDAMVPSTRTRTGYGICNKNIAILKVYMYDMPPEFHFGMIEKALSSRIWPMNFSQIPRYPGGLNLQHSPEYWLTLDLLASTMPNGKSPCTAIRVKNPKDADVFFVPFFSSLSYNKYSRLEGRDKNVELQEKLVQYLLRQNAWRRSGGRNHVIVMHHPNSLHVAREQVRSAMFIVADFARYSPQVANMGKDVVAPYKHLIPTFTEDFSTYETRETLLFFRGVIVRKEGGIIRQRLYELLKNEPGIVFGTGNTQRDGIRSATKGMQSSKFCLHLAGDTPSSNRLFDAIASHCVPVIISDEIELPFEDELNYSEFCLFVRSIDALQRGFLIKLLKSVKKPEWTQMWTRLKEVDRHFEYQHPVKRGDAVDMTWKSIARRLPSIKQSLHKGKRYSRSRLVNLS